MIRRSLEQFEIAGRLIAECYNPNEQLLVCQLAHDWIVWVNNLPCTTDRKDTP